MEAVCGESRFPLTGGTHFFPFYISRIVVNTWKALLVFMGLYLDKDLIVHSLYVHLEGRKTGMSMSFEYSVYLYGFGTFLETCHTPAYSHLYE